ncbi:hypothetical protein [Hellea balneolensis]|uniref:hypothetical protein n=1 Tax=Hellea balneolensis TaxID=287478 RepID=UPI00041BF0FF|nr:hypothetical protein [Hellea balneolensis]
MTVWYRQSTKTGFNLVPVGMKGSAIFSFNLLTFIIPIFVLFGLWPQQTLTRPIAILVFISSILFFIFSLKYKADYSPYDQDQN